MGRDSKKKDNPTCAKQVRPQKKKVASVFSADVCPSRLRRQRFCGCFFFFWDPSSTPSRTHCTHSLHLLHAISATRPPPLFPSLLFLFHSTKSNGITPLLSHQPPICDTFTTTYSSTLSCFLRHSFILPLTHTHLSCHSFTSLR